MGGYMEESIDKKQTFMGGVLVVLFSQIIVKILGLVYRLAITNIPYFGDEGNGLYGAGFQIYVLILAIASIGVPGAIAKLVSERVAVGKHKEAHRIFKIAFVLFAVIGLIGSSMLFFGAKYISTDLIGNSDVEGVLAALSPSIFFVAISAVIRGYFNGLYNMKATANSQMLEQLFKSVLTVVIVLGIYFIGTANPAVISNYIHIPKENITEIMAAGANLATTLATVLSFFYLYAFYSKRKKEIWSNINNSKGDYKRERVRDIVRKILFLSIPMSLASIVAAINRNIDTFTVIRGVKSAFSQLGMVGEQLEATATRLYGILSGKVDMLIGLPLALNVAFATALVPAVAGALAKGDKRTANRRISFSLRTTMLIGVPCSIGLIVLAGPILHLLFPGAPASEAELLLQISSLTIIFTSLSQTVNGSLQGIGKIFIPALSLAVGATAKLILNLLLVYNPNIHIYGAAIGSVVCHVISSTIGYIVLSKNIKLDVNATQMIFKPMAAGAIMGAVAYYLQVVLARVLGRPSVATLIAILASVITYLLALILLKVFSRDDYHMLPYGDKIYNSLVKIKLINT
jgi:stage V sporulation protein B